MTLLLIPILAAALGGDAQAPKACLADFTAVAAQVPYTEVKQKLAGSADQLAAREGGAEAALAAHKKALANTDKIWLVLQRRPSGRAYEVIKAERLTQTAIIDAMQCRVDGRKG